jgi:hypothetical protein
MAPVVRVEPNGLQAFLTYDDAIDMLSQAGWLGFIQLFRGFNIEVARAFTGILMALGLILVISNFKWMRNSLLRIQVSHSQGRNGSRI